MARKIKFALEMANGVKVRSNLEELREHFDLEKAVGYFLSGKLAEWLEDRYYDVEAEKIQAIDKDAPDLNKKLCAALGVEYDEKQNVNVEQIERINEKRAILRQKTDDESIIAHAGQTAFTQEDLAELLDMDEPIIYLCGDSFTIPVRVENKKYIGILGTPKIKISVQSEAELAAKGIVCENLLFPWTKETPVKETYEDFAPLYVEPKKMKENVEPKALTPPVEQEELPEEDTTIDELREIYSSSFYGNTDTWEVAYSSDKLNDAKKKIALRLICKNRYKESDLVHIKVSSDLSGGWALTRDSICFGGRLGNLIVKYQDIDGDDGEPIYETSKFKSTFSFDEIFTYSIRTRQGVYELCSGVEREGVEILDGDHSNLNTYLGVASKMF